jgi:HlyD family secretion protein
LVSKFGEDDTRTEKAHDEYLDALGAYNRAVENAELQMTAAQNDVTQAYHALQQAQDDLDDLLAGADERDIEAAQLDVDQARASLEQARLSLEKATLTAPTGGTVTELNVQPGEMASAGQTAVVLSDVAVLEVELNLDETDVAQAAIGQEALVSVDAFPGVKLAGEVTYIAPVAQIDSGVVLYPLTVRLAPTDIPVRAGMTADVEITTASQEGVLIVPLRAVHTEGEHAYVYRLVGAQTERVEVALGMMTDTEVEIITGADGTSVAEGDVVSVVAAPTPGSTGRGFGPGGIFGGGEDQHD